MCESFFTWGLDTNYALQVCARMREIKSQKALQRLRSAVLNDVRTLTKSINNHSVIRHGYVLMAVTGARSVSSWKLSMVESKRRHGGGNVSFTPAALLDLAYDDIHGRNDVARKYKCSAKHVNRIRCLVASASMHHQQEFLNRAAQQFVSVPSNLALSLLVLSSWSNRTCLTSLSSLLSRSMASC